MIVHIIGFSYEEEPMKHELFFCGTYFAFLLIGIFGIIAVLFGFRIFILMEAIVSFTATICFICAAFISMARAEQDMHLLLFTDDEEEEHFFFQIHRRQSYFSLAAGLLYLLHGILCMDMLIITPDLQNQAPGRNIPKAHESDTDLDERAQYEPLNLQFTLKPFFKNIRTFLDFVFGRGEFSSRSSSLSDVSKEVPMTEMSSLKNRPEEPQPGTSKQTYDETAL